MKPNAIESIEYMLLDLGDLLLAYLTHGPDHLCVTDALQTLKGHLNDFETDLRKDPSSTGSRRSHGSDDHPERMQRCDPRPARELGGSRRQGTPTGTAVGNEPPQRHDLSTRSGT